MVTITGNVGGITTFETVTTVDVESVPLNAMTVVVPAESAVNTPTLGLLNVPTDEFILTQITGEAK